MALDFPAPLPVPHRVATVAFTIDRVLAASRARGGAVQVAERGRSLWRCAFTTAPLKGVHFEAWRAWLDAQRGGLNTFLAFDTQRCRPQAYPGSSWSLVRWDGSPFDGTGDVLTSTGYHVELANLPAGYVVTPGDYLSWPWGSTRTLHRVVQGGIATGAGQITVQVEPDVPTDAGLPETVKLERADAVFRVIETPDLPRSGVLGEPFTLRAIQHLV
jgi:hypothetical protein